MKSASRIITYLIIGGGMLAVAHFATLAEEQKPMATSDTPPAQPIKPVKKSDAEWKKKLTPEQYRVARQAGTERPGGEVYKQFKKQGAGTYYCVGCDAELFSSKEKFDARCGWPSFYDPSKAKNVKAVPDIDGLRIEVVCKVCDAHLGHVFTGEGFNTPTDKRYCINGTVLKFVPAKNKGEKKQEPGKE
ncbi:MAG: peptide-methionine (R)-S-oxide reductase MsrB [Akkermansiaceae bacterium]